MEPKEKALDMINDIHLATDYALNDKEAIECALLTICQLVSVVSDSISRVEYWQKVGNELNNLNK